MPTRTATSKPPTTRLGREERRRSILRSAARTFSAGGYAATSMDAIAAEAGITKLIVYRHFESKDDLYRQILGEVVTAIRTAETAGLDAGVGPSVHARALLHAARTNPDGFRLLFRHAAREPEFAGFAERSWRRAVKFALALVSPWLPDVALHRWAAETVVAFLVTSTLNWLDHGEPERDEEFVALLTASLGALVSTWAGNTVVPEEQP